MLFKQEKVGLGLAVASCLVAHTSAGRAAPGQQRRASGWLDPWARRDGWRSHGPSMRRFD